MKRSVAFIHTSPAAIGPLMQFYSEHAPELEITNLLDDGLPVLKSGNFSGEDFYAKALAAVSRSAQFLP